MIIKILFFLIALSLNISGTYFLARATIKSRNDISAMSGTFFDSNPNIERIFKRDNKKAVVGLSLLIPGILLQFSFTLIEIFKK